MIDVELKIQRLIHRYKKMTGTNDPLKIAEHLGIHVVICPLGNIAGNYRYLKKIRWIFINENIEKNSPMFKVVMAHELGHALLHSKENCAFIKHHTMLLTSGIEQEANLFAAHLLITDDMLNDFVGYTYDQFNRFTGYPIELLKYRL